MLFNILILIEYYLLFFFFNFYNKKTYLKVNDIFEQIQYFLNQELKKIFKL